MIWSILIQYVTPVLCFVIIVAMIWHRMALSQHLAIIKERLQTINQQRQQLDSLLSAQQKAQYEQQQRFDQHQINSLKLIQDSVQKGMQDVRAQLQTTLMHHTETLNRGLKDISGEVDRRLTTSFAKTTATFTDVVKRLTIIDEAQKKITQLSSSVIDLQAVLQDKKSRGAFGEVQLMQLIRNLIPEKHFAEQHTLSNKNRVDCMLFLPEPSGHIGIDAKFPLESYRQMINPQISESERKRLEQQFRRDIRRHIQTIAKKYIIAGETADGAVMFIPSEAIFADIHAHFCDCIDYAHQQRVWLVSPTTLMAILNTARAVLKDAATRAQVNIIQEHLLALSKDFDRFQKRMDKLSEHIAKAHDDVEQVHKSSKKISSRFNKIEQVELTNTADTQIALQPIVESSDDD